MGKRSINYLPIPKKKIGDIIRDLVCQCLVDASELKHADDHDLEWIVDELRIEFGINVYLEEIQGLSYSQIVTLIREKLHVRV